jgi:hypothetical protein
MKQFKNFVMPVKAFLCIVIPFVLALVTIAIISIGISLVAPVSYTAVVSFPFTGVFGVILFIAYLYVTAEWLFD